MRPLLWDMHVHLDFMRDPQEIVREAEAIGLGMFAVTVTPQDYLAHRETLKDTDHMKFGIGLHPWWIADGRCSREDAVSAAELAKNTRFVGEIGLDASPKHVPEGSLETQIEAVGIICEACGKTSDPEAPKVLSLHSVRSAGLLLDVLERTGCLDSCRCIFHWFTGSNEELTRAIRAGCMFSVNGMMLDTRRGREYARQIPADRLLLETDFPPGRDIPFSAAAIASELEKTLSELESIRGSALRDIIRSNSVRTLGISNEDRVSHK